MAVIAPWILRNNPLDFLSQGAHVGLAARAADQAQQRMAQEADRAAIAQQMAQQREDQDAQQAANLLRYHYDALGQARQNQERDDTARERGLELAQALKREEDAATALYRTGVLKNQADRNAYLVGKPSEPKTYHVGDHLVQVDPTGNVKTLFSKPDAETIPMVSGVKLTPDEPTSPSLRLRANDPLLNQLLGTNATNLGTNWVSRAPKAKAAPVAPAPMAEGSEDLTRDEPVEAEVKALDKATASEFLKQAKGDKEKARQLARDAGYSF